MVKTQTTIGLDVELREKVKDHVHEKRISLASLINKLLAEYLEKIEGENGEGE